MGKFFALGLFLISAIATADSFEIGWDRPGYDYSNFELKNPREILCQWSCQKDGRCRAWTFVKPGLQGPYARCWLKYAVPRAVRNTCCTSGYIGKRNGMADEDQEDLFEQEE